MPEKSVARKSLSKSSTLRVWSEGILVVCAGLVPLLLKAEAIMALLSKAGQEAVGLFGAFCALVLAYMNRGSARHGIEAAEEAAKQEELDVP
jgi:hypothetical protein